MYLCSLIDSIFQNDINISVDRKPFECEVYRFKDKKSIKLNLCSILILVINTHNQSFLALNLYTAHSKGFISTDI